LDNLPCSDVVDLRWPVMGDRLPVGHNYRLYSALIAQEPALKSIPWQLVTITGVPDRADWIKLGRSSEMGIRCAVADLHLFSGLDNQIIRIGQHLLQLGELHGKSIEPVGQLRSRLVTIKSLFTCRVDKFQFGVVLGKQLQKLGVDAMPTLLDRNTVKIKDTTVVGYGVSFSVLTPKDSLTLQSLGVGGRRRMGCGVFLPS